VRLCSCVLRPDELGPVPSGGASVAAGEGARLSGRALGLEPALRRRQGLKVRREHMREAPTIEIRKVARDGS
jgi:hypothetical protein